VRRSEAAKLTGQALSPLTLRIADEHLGGFAAGMHGIRLCDVSMLYVDLHVPPRKTSPDWATTTPSTCP
jgi:hypothetical protein